MEFASFRPFAHLATPSVALYRLIMGEFVAAKRRFVVHLRGEDLKEALAQDAASGHVSLYDLLHALAPSPVVTLNRRSRSRSRWSMSRAPGWPASKRWTATVASRRSTGSRRSAPICGGGEED